MSNVLQQAVQLYGQGRFVDAELLCKKILAKSPKNADALHVCGLTFLQRNITDKAVTFLEKAFKAAKDNEQIRNNYVNALYAHANNLAAVAGLYQEALPFFDLAIKYRPRFPEAINNRGMALLELRDFSAAEKNFSKLLELSPDYPFARGWLIHAKLYACSWDNFQVLVDRLEKELLAGGAADTPLSALCYSDNPAAQLASAAAFCRNQLSGVSPLSNYSVKKSAEKIRIAYVSADFRWHAMAFLMAGVFEHHDRNRFELVGISIGADDGSDYARRTRMAFDQFYDWAEFSDQDIIQKMRAMEIDIAIDLMGFSSQARFGIFAGRCAPVQINYLGYPATMGADFIDYIIADRFVIPEESRKYYAEKIIYLPDTFQANDNKRQISPVKPSRQALGLPDDQFIWCSFNHSHKLTPDVFAIWMKLLLKVPDSVLWIYADNELAKNNLRKQAALSGVNEQRLIFAGKANYPDHLARLACADLFLDSYPFNAGTTASDALWAGLPLLTCAGKTFAARMAGSLLNAAGLPELVTASLEEYEELACRLALDRPLLASYRQQLADSRDSCALFDTARFCHHLEKAYESVYLRNQAGLPAETFYIEKSYR